MKHFGTSLVSLVWVISILASASSVRAEAPDLSTPKSALLAYLVGQVVGDAETLKAASVGVDPAVLDGVAAMWSAKAHLEEVAAKQFAASPGAKPAAPLTREQWTQKLGGLKDPQLKDNVATSTLGGKAITIRQVDGQWRVDAASVLGVTSPEQGKTVAHGLQLQAKAANEIAQEVSENKYADWTAAQTAWGQRIIALTAADPEAAAAQKPDATSAGTPAATPPPRTQAPQGLQSPSSARPASPVNPGPRRLPGRRSLVELQSGAGAPPSPEGAAAKLKQIEDAWQSSKDKSTDLTSHVLGFTAAKGDGALKVGAGGSISTTETFQPAVTFHIIALTDDKDIRLSYGANQIIFNWDMRHDELRVDGGPPAGKHKPGAGLLPANQWVGIELTVKPTEMIIAIDGKERYRVSADFSKVNEPLGVRAHTGDLWIKSIAVIKQ
jgi:hypothetical protein